MPIFLFSCRLIRLYCRLYPNFLQHNVDYVVLDAGTIRKNERGGERQSEIKPFWGITGLLFIYSRMRTCDFHLKYHPRKIIERSFSK